MDRLDAMQVLLAVVDEGSLSAGSRKLNCSLPSVSRKLAELEDRLGSRLLIRTTRNIELTDAGRDYVDTIRPIVALLDEAERRASGEYEAPRGKLSVIVSGEFGRRVAIPIIFDFLDEHPEITLNILKTGRHLDLIEEHVDVAIRIGSLADSSLYSVKVGDIAVSTVASTDYLQRKGRPAHPDDLTDHDGIQFLITEPQGWVYSVDGERFDCPPTMRVAANLMHFTVQAAVRGLGIARVGSYHVEEELRSGSLVRILEEYECTSVPVHLVYIKQGPLPLKVRAFLDWMTPRLRTRLEELNAAVPPS